LHGECEMNLREYLGIAFRPFAGKLDLATQHGMTTAFQYQYDVVAGASTGTRQHQLHWARRKIVAAPIGGAIHCRYVSTARAGYKQHAFGATPVYRAFHVVDPDFHCHRVFHHHTTQWHAAAGAESRCRYCRVIAAKNLMKPQPERNDTESCKQKRRLKDDVDKGEELMQRKHACIRRYKIHASSQDVAM
jgi:hypothetical protein